MEAQNLSIKAKGSRTILFMDDNPVGNKSYAKELFRAMIRERVRWCSQCTINIAEDAELLDLAAKSGCLAIRAPDEADAPERDPDRRPDDGRAR